MVKTEFLEQMKIILTDEEFREYLHQSECTPKRGFRINLLKTNEKEMRGILDFAWVRNPYSENSWILPDDVKPVTLPSFRQGLFYVQEPSAASSVFHLDPKPGMKVLDLCAAPGSKTTQILELMGNEGLLAANEYEASRAGILAENVERCGAANCLILNADTKDVADAFPQFFDAVLCDAPCSGEGMFRKDPQAAKMWSPNLVEACAKRQKYILNQAYRTLKPGGVLVYSTCTLNRTEDEGAVLAFLEEHPDMEIDPITGQYPGQVSNVVLPGSLKILPNDFGEGHFVCRMKKKDGESSGKKKTLSSRISPAAAEFLANEINGAYPYAYEKNGHVYVSGEPFYDCGRCRIVRAGIPAGEILKNRFEPDHALYMSEMFGFARTFELDDTQMGDYIRGLEIKAETEKGWYCVSYGGHHLGCAKSDGRTLKNKYPKRYRMR